MRVELTAGRRLLGRQAGTTRGWRALTAGLAGLGLAIIGQTGAGAQTGLVTVQPDCIEAGRARYGIEVRSEHNGPVSGTVKSTATGETLNTYQIEANGTVRTAAPVGEKRLTFVTTTPDGLTDTDQVETQECGATTTVSSIAVTSTTVAAVSTGGTTGTGGTTATTTAPAATSTPVAAPASSAQPSLMAAASQPTATRPAASLAATGSSRVDYFLRLAAASFMLGLLCMFITQRRRYRRIDAWLSYVFNNF